MGGGRDAVAYARKRETKDRMSDIFREVDEDVRRDRFEQIWKQYGNLIISAALVMVAAVGGWQVYGHFRLQQEQRASAKFQTAIELSQAGKDAEAEKLLFPASGASRAVNALHDDWRSIAVRGGRRRCTLGAWYMFLYMFLGARRRGRRRPKDNDGQGEGHHSG